MTPGNCDWCFLPATVHWINMSLDVESSQWAKFALVKSLSALASAYIILYAMHWKIKFALVKLMC